MIENRRSRRKSAREGIEIVNALTGESVGQLGNLSIDGMLLMAHHEIASDALFQFRFELPATDGDAAQAIEIGVHEQWSEPAKTPGQFWAGFRIIDIAPDERTLVAAWVARFDDEPLPE